MHEKTNREANEASFDRLERNTVKRTTNETMNRTIIARIAAGVLLIAALVPGVVAWPNVAQAATAREAMAADAASVDSIETARESVSDGLSRALALNQEKQTDKLKGKASRSTQVNDVSVETSETDAESPAPSNATEKLLEYNPDDLAAVGTQESTGHSICCPSFSCAYADAVLDGTVHDHYYYGCSCCMWTDWGGGNSSYRCVGSDEELLREAYDEISAGRPTVIHVSAGYGEHWIALIGYTDAVDPDNLTLANFIALDPWDGAQIIASDRFSLYGDGCEHISERSL